MIRVPSPQPEAVTQILLKISKKEGIKLPESFAMKIAHFSKGNVRKAILALEAARVQSYPFSEQQSIPTPDWEIYVDSISQMMISEQSPQRLLGIRSKFYELLTNCIPPRIIFRTLTESLLKRLDDDRLKLKVIELAADYEQKSNLGSKAIFHLEGFVAKFMVVFKAHLLELLE